MDAPIGGVQVLFGHRNNTALPLDPACPEHLSDHSWAVLPYYDFHQGFLFPKFLNSFHCWVSQALNGNCPRWAVAFLQKCYWVATKEVPKHITNLISLISKTGLKSPRITNFSCFFFHFLKKKITKLWKFTTNFHGFIARFFNSNRPLHLCVSDIVLPNQSIVRHHETLITHTIKSNACRIICPAEDHAHEEEVESRQFFNLTHELNVWMKHKFQGFLFVCKTQKVTIMLESRQQAIMAMHW